MANVPKCTTLMDALGLISRFTGSMLQQILCFRMHNTSKRKNVIVSMLYHFNSIKFDKMIHSIRACYIYLYTFTININQMQVDVPYADGMGLLFGLFVLKCVTLTNVNFSLIGCILPSSESWPVIFPRKIPTDSRNIPQVPQYKIWKDFLRKNVVMKGFFWYVFQRYVGVFLRFLDYQSAPLVETFGIPRKDELFHRFHFDPDFFSWRQFHAFTS